MSKFKKEVSKLIFVIVLMFVMFILFGSLSLLVVNKELDYVKIISGTVMACGLYGLAISIKFVPEPQGRRFYYNLPGIFFGMALISGAALYYVFETAFWFFFSFGLPLLIGGIYNGLKAEKAAAARKRQDTRAEWDPRDREE
ncbi:MAG: hypothetical protein PHV36_03575 [Elusimicrobiales bacterium]|nr:hypothetical protein [Elusimicrobiales bacterium]